MDLANICLIMRHLLVFWDALKIRWMLGIKTSNRGLNPLVWPTPNISTIDHFVIPVAFPVLCEWIFRYLRQSMPNLTRISHLPSPLVSFEWLMFPRSGPSFKPPGWFWWSEPELSHFGLFGPFGPCAYDDINKLQNDPYWRNIHPHLVEIWPKMGNPHFMMYSWMWVLKFAL